MCAWCIWLCFSSYLGFRLLSITVNKAVKHSKIPEWFSKHSTLNKDKTDFFVDGMLQSAQEGCISEGCAAWAKEGGVGAYFFY